ncbi:MAG: DVU_1557 family redox protein [Oscillospiraceae bacterium]
METVKTEPKDVRCALDDIPMVQTRVEVTYLTHVFPVELMVCPKCRQVYIPEDVRNKMREVEETLEEK